MVHRNQIAQQAIKSFRKVFGSVSMGMISGSLGQADYDKDYILQRFRRFAKMIHYNILHRIILMQLFMMKHIIQLQIPIKRL